MSISVQVTKRLRSGDADLLGIDCRPALRKNEVITSVASVESVPEGLTLENGQPNAGVVEVAGQDVPAGKALLCNISGGEVGTTYEVIFTCVTTQAPTLSTEGVRVQVY